MVVRVGRFGAGEAATAAPSRAHAWIEVDLGALRRNIAILRGGLPRSCKLIAVVKGDAYGHGAVAVAKVAVECGAAALAVANAFEGAELRAAGITAPILVIGPSTRDEFPLLLAHGLVPALADLDSAQRLDRMASEPFAVQVEVDTGLRRHGVDARDAVALVHAVTALPRLRLLGTYTHFASIGPADVDLARGQFARFEAVLRGLRQAGLHPLVHACNTLGSVLVPDAHLDAVRIGGGLHGLGATSRSLGLTPTLTLKSRVALVRSASRGDCVGYGGGHVCVSDTRLAVLPCGYADGLSRATWTGREVLIHGRRARIAGLVSMNQIIVDVGRIPEPVAAGDEVVLLGAQGEQRVRAEEGLPAGASSYEVTTLLHPALPRVWRDGSQRLT